LNKVLKTKLLQRKPLQKVVILHVPSLLYGREIWALK